MKPTFYKQYLSRFSQIVALATVVLVTACGGDSGRVGSRDGEASSSAAPTASPSVVVRIGVSTAAVTAGQSSTLTWTSGNATSCIASGAWAGAQALSGSATVSQSEFGTYSYTLTCAGSGGTSAGTSILAVTGEAQNVAPVILNAGPSGHSLNQPFVSVTICQPGTSTCQTIDHILVDTGSYGLRIIAPGIVNPSLILPAVTNAAGHAVGECAQFVGGYAWGAVRQADVKMAGELAPAIPIELIGDAGAAYAAIPASCSNTGANLGTVAALGANGILGVGLFNQDCGIACLSADSGVYFGCASSCMPTAIPLVDQVANPVAAFAINNNGVAIVLPSVSPGGLTSATGSLIFGIDTQANNGIGASQVAYKANDQANFTTTYKGIAYTSSFLDSGSNGIFFPDATIPMKNEWFNPASMLSLSATNTASDGSTSGTVNFTIDPISAIADATVAASVGGTVAGINGFDWGLPFFFGRTVFVAIEGKRTSRGTGPLWAY